ncbi:MAG: 50S ribosomal protein L11 methyltransferase [Polyangiaceae bacterium]
MSQTTENIPRFPFVLVDVAADYADEMSSILFELGADGLEERDATTLSKGVGDLVTLVASFGTLADANEAIAALDPAHHPRLEEIIGDAWRDAWKEHFHPFLLCDGLVVAPPWEKYDGKLGEAHVLELEPGRAFGTGLHETTSLVAQALANHAAEFHGAEILDVGCGSGILALVAIAFGASHARAIDNDADVIGVVHENAERNGYASRITADTTMVEDFTAHYSVVVANIEAEVLISMAGLLDAHVAPHGLLVLSGILATKRDRVREAFASLELLDAPARGEWVALILRKS